MEIVVLAETMLVHTSLAPFARWGSRFDGPDLLTMLVLFILARVFRQGAIMQGNLEGTVWWTRKQTALP